MTQISLGPIGPCSFFSFVAFNARTRSDNPRKVTNSVAKFVANGVVTRDARKPMVKRHIMAMAKNVTPDRSRSDARNAIAIEAHMVIATLATITQDGRTRFGSRNRVFRVSVAQNDRRLCSGKISARGVDGPNRSATLIVIV